MGIYRLPNGLVAQASCLWGQRASRLLSRTMLKPCQLVLKSAGRMPARPTARMAVLLSLTIAPVSIFGAVKNRALPQLPGYKAVPVHYGPLNKMIMSVRINGQPANLLVDTGSNEIILDADAAESFGVKPSQGGLRYIRRTQINGQRLFVGFAQNITAGSMNFGSNLVALRNPT